MLVKLPRHCSGQEVVEAFRAASTFQESPDKKWKAQEFANEFQYEPGSVRQVIRSKRVTTRLYTLEKRWIFFGKKEWLLLGDIEFTLKPLLLKGDYEEVEVEINSSYRTFGGRIPVFDPPPQSPAFERIRPVFEVILKNLFARLQPQNA